MTQSLAGELNSISILTKDWSVRTSKAYSRRPEELNQGLNDRLREPALFYIRYGHSLMLPSQRAKLQSRTVYPTLRGWKRHLTARQLCVCFSQRMRGEPTPACHSPRTSHPTASNRIPTAYKAVARPHVLGRQKRCDLKARKETASSKPSWESNPDRHFCRVK